MSDNTVYSYINDIAQRLKEPRKYGDVSLMIGAGFSKNAQSKGMASMQPPNWSELAEKMYEELLMNEEGLKETANKMIFIGKPIEFDEEVFRQLVELEREAMDETSDIRAAVEKIVTTYHPAEE